MIRRDHLAGLLLVVLGLGAALEGYAHELGTLRAMGPGLLPFMLGLMLAGLGVMIATTAGEPEPASALPPVMGEHAEFQGAEWRGWGCIVGGVVAFLVLGHYAGLVPATFACVFTSALGDRKSSLPGALGLAAVVTVAGVILFWWVLKVQLPLFRWGPG